nr:integrase, catalytic region, zinc finger, CCHC-type, peptidase aspartic, catalytic [Tanacetum cinerariifolium]
MNAPAAPDGFAPQWIGEHDPNNNGWIEWDVPLGGELDEPMVDPEVNEEVMDDDDWNDEVECGETIFPLPAPRLHVPPIMIEDLGTRLGNLKYRHGVLVRKMEDVSDAEVADSIAIGEIHPRVATVGEQVQVMGSQTRQIVSRLKEIETRVQQVESIVDTHSSGQMAVQGQDVIARSSQQCLFVKKLLWIFVRDKMSRDVITVGSTMRIPLLYREKKTRKIDRLARSLLIQGLPNDIYSFIDSNETAKDLWDALERQMRDSEYGEQDRKTAIWN